MRRELPVQTEDCTDTASLSELAQSDSFSASAFQSPLPSSSLFIGAGKKSFQVVR